MSCDLNSYTMDFLIEKGQYDAKSSANKLMAALAPFCHIVFSLFVDFWMVFSNKLDELCKCKTFSWRNDENVSIPFDFIEESEYVLIGCWIMGGILRDSSVKDCLVPASPGYSGLVTLKQPLTIAEYG